MALGHLLGFAGEAQGGRSRYQTKNVMFSRILVVCTGNICRSPIGEALLRARLGDKVQEVASAGIGALIGYPADPMAVEVSAEQGVDLSAHRAQQVSSALLARMELVLTMDRTHSDWLLRQYPHMRGRVHKMLKWRDDADVADPYRLPKAAFITAYQEIAQGVEDWAAKI